MTVAVQALPITYNGNGTAAPLAVPFRFLAANHLVVTRIAANGARTILTRGTHYTVSGGGEGPSGTVTPLAPIAVGDKWEIDRATPREQPTAYPVGDDFPAKTHELALDRAMMVAQEQDRRASDIETRAPLALPGQVAPPLDIAGLQNGELIQYISGKLQRLPKAQFAGKVLGGDAAGNVIPFSGTGADAALRTDMATNLGFQLIKYKRAETGTFARTAAEMSRISAFDNMGVALAHWLPPDLDEAILSASNGSMLNSYLQAAFDNTRANVPLVFPPNAELRTSATIYNPRAIPIQGNWCQWRGYFGADTASDLLRVEPTSDKRGFFVRDMRMSFSIGGRHVLRLKSDGLPGALIDFDISNNQFGTVGDGVTLNGFALYLEGLGTHIGRVCNNGIAGGIYAATADRIVYETNLIGGYNGIKLDLIDGAFCTHIKNNAIVSRDGIVIENGQNIHITGNQIEQFGAYGANANGFSSQLVMYGLGTLPILNCVVENNNFGGGTNCLSPITLVANVEHCRFRNNQYNFGSTFNDVRILDGSVKYCSFDEQFFRNTGRDTSDPLIIFDAGTANRGVWKGATGLTFSNGWSAGTDFQRMIDPHISKVLLAGSLIVGSAATTTDLITVLPEGYRPKATTVLLCGNGADNAIAKLELRTNGQVYPAGPMPAAGTSIFLPGGYRAKVADTLSVGAI